MRFLLEESNCFKVEKSRVSPQLGRAAIRPKSQFPRWPAGAPVTGFASGDAMATDWQSARDGFDHRRDKPKDRPINWKYWASLHDWTQWDACALSLNINPENMEKIRTTWMAGPVIEPIFQNVSFPSQAVKDEFDNRMGMFRRVARGNPRATVSPAVYAAWCLHVGLEDLPPELVAMAAPEPKAAPEPQAPPVMPDGASRVTAGPLPLPTGDIAYCFAGLRWKTEDEWKKPLGDKPKWLEACIAIPAVRGVSETHWYPVLIGAALVRQGHVSARTVRAAFQTKPLLMPWLEAWKTYEADYFATD